MRITRLVILLTALVSLPPLSHAQTTYAIGASTCGAGSTTWIDCHNVLLTIGTTTTTMWLEADYPPYTAEDFFWGAVGDYTVSNVRIESFTNICWASLGKHYCENLPAEITANLTGVEGTTVTGALDLKIAYIIGRTGRYTSGAIASTAGGSVTIK